MRVGGDPLTDGKLNPSLFAAVVNAIRKISLSIIFLLFYSQQFHASIAESLESKLDTPQIVTSCVSKHIIDKLSGKLGYSNITYRSLNTPLYSSSPSFPPCHTQGFTRTSDGEHFVVTCMDKTDSKSSTAYILIYKAQDNNSDYPDSKPVVTVPLTEHGNYIHPSGIQAFGNTFATALTKRRDRNGPSRILFFNVQSDGQIRELVSLRLKVSDHIGAIALGEVSGWLTMIGCSFDCKKLWFWRMDQGKKFRYVLSGRFSRLVDQTGIDIMIRKYSEIKIAHRCQDRQPLLIGTYNYWLDIWEIHELDNEQEVRLKKVATTKIDRAIFQSGTHIDTQHSSLIFLTAPTDYLKYKHCGLIMCVETLFSASSLP